MLTDIEKVLQQSYELLTKAKQSKQVKVEERKEVPKIKQDPRAAARAQAATKAADEKRKHDLALRVLQQKRKASESARAAPVKERPKLPSSILRHLQAPMHSGATAPAASARPGDPAAAGRRGPGVVPGPATGAATSSGGSGPAAGMARGGAIRGYAGAVKRSETDSAPAPEQPLPKRARADTGAAAPASVPRRATAVQRGPPAPDSAGPDQTQAAAWEQPPEAPHAPRAQGQGDTLFIGDLPPGMSGDELGHAMSQYGQVESARVVGMQRFGFVKYASPEAAAGVLEAVADGPLVLQGAPVRVSWARGAMPEWQRGPASFRAHGRGEALEAYEDPQHRKARLAAQHVADAVYGSQGPDVQQGRSGRQQVAYDDL